MLLVTALLFLYRTDLFLKGQPIDSQKFDHFGSIIGGLVGSIWTLSSIILFYVALTEQRKATADQREAINDQKKSIAINTEALEAQVKSLKLQTQEFELQRNELAQTREVFTEQSKTLKLQQFESTFFSMLNLHHDIVKSISTIKIIKETSHGLTTTKERVLAGRECFVFFYQVFGAYYSKLRSEKDGTETAELLLIDKSYTTFYREFQSNLSHYFRNLYNILKFIHKKNPGDKFFYSNLLRAQLSASELLLLFYNCLSQFGEKFKPLIEEYHFLQNMPKKPLIDKSLHTKLYAKEAFGEPGERAEEI